MPLKTRRWNRHGTTGLTLPSLALARPPWQPLPRRQRGRGRGNARCSLERRHPLFRYGALYGLGLSETRLNRFLRGKPRGEYVLSTKVGRLLRTCAPGEDRDCIGKFFDVPARKEVYDYSHDGVLRSVEFSSSGWASTG